MPVYARLRHSSGPLLASSRSNEGSLQRAKGTLGDDGHISFAFFARKPVDSTTDGENAEILVHFDSTSGPGFWRVGWDTFGLSAYLNNGDPGIYVFPDPGNDWFYVGISVNEDSMIARYRRAADSSFTGYTREVGEWISGTGGVAWGATVTGSVGDGSWPADADFAGLKIWSASLSAAELEAEFASLAPVRTSGIWSANDGLDVSNIGVDQSGAGHPFTVLGTWTAGAGSPPWT